MNIADVLADAGVPHVGADHEHGRPGWVQVDCPDCGTVGRYHLGINLSNGAAACWRCGKKNTAWVLAKLLRIDHKRARRIIDGAATVPTTRRHTGTLWTPPDIGPLLPGHRSYLADRGFDPDTLVRLWGIGGIGQSGRLRWRVYIPVVYEGAVVSWTARAISDHPMRYISASSAQEAIPHKHILYGSDYTRRRAVIVHEGPIDVWATGPGAVGTFGTGYTDAQLAALATYDTRVLCFDGSDEAQSRAARLGDDLGPYPGRTVRVRLTSGEDAAAADRREVALLRRRYLG